MKPDIVIVGLGNPGTQYAGTRHNAGFRAVSLLARHCGAGEWQPKQKFLAEVAEGSMGGKSALFVRPQTFMNRSGEAVGKIIPFYKLDASRALLILSDDIDLPLGALRFRESGGPGTHNGLKSVVDALGEGFPRLRIGLGAPPAGADLAAWVLSVPPPAEAKLLEEAIAKTPEMVEQRVASSA
ncbi:MAG: aminoacyl-tRNA hydrolase [Candidatus Peribacteraceae bacterium]|nr:aminoacyl-tRNA hydrolase [Candidatus Peribacteraceae bacterium]